MAIPTAAVIGLVALAALDLNLHGLTGFLVQAFLLGRSHAEDHLGLAARDRRNSVLIDALPSVRAEVDDVRAAMEKQAERAREILAGAMTREDLETGVLAAQRIGTVAETGVTTAVHAQVAEGTKTVANERRVMKVWLAERDACPTCLSLSGEIQKNGTFDASRTFAIGPDNKPRPMKVYKPPLTGPPRHPNCRCQLVAWDGTDTGGSGLNFPKSLKREAKRSIVLGLALPSESVPARMRAARVLLAAGAGLPQSVEDRAWARIRRGKFKTRVAP